MNKIDAVIYIHGFRGSAQSPKVGSMRDHFEKQGIKVFAPTYNDTDAHKSHHHLTQFVSGVIKQYPHSVLVGCSLGGFWAHYLGNQFRLPSVLLNPAIKPWVTLKKYIPEAAISHQQVVDFKDFDMKYAKPTTVYEPRIVLVEQGDDVIDPNETVKTFTGHAKVESLPGGTHRFENFAKMNDAIEEVGNTIVTHGA